MKYLLTGSEGLIGSKIKDLLEDKGEVVCYDKKLSKDVLDGIEENSVDMIVHTAANTFIRETISNPDLGLENIKITHEVYEFARKNGVDKVIAFSSSRASHDEYNPYIVSKLYLENTAKAYRDCYGIRTATVRPETVWGYTQDDRVMVKWIRKALNGEDIEIYGDENKELSPLHVDDFIDELKDIVEFFNDFADGTVTISGKIRKAEDIAETIIEETNSESDIEYVMAEPTQPQTCPRGFIRVKSDLRSDINKVINKINNE